MRAPLRHLVAVAAAGLIAFVALGLDSVAVGFLAGGMGLMALQDIGRALARQLEPASRAERRLARAVESAVRRRSTTLDRETGAHAA